MRPLTILAVLGLVGEIVLTRWIARRRKSHTAAPVIFSSQTLDVSSYRSRAREMLAVPSQTTATGEGPRR